MMMLRGSLILESSATHCRRSTVRTFCHCTLKSRSGSQALAPRGVPYKSSSFRRRKPDRLVCYAVQKSFYQLLEVDQTATERDIKSAYRKKALKLHPDVNKAADAQQRFLEVKAAFETLSDPKARAAYDRQLRGGFASGFDFGYGGKRATRGAPSEPDYSLEDFFKDMEKEVKEWSSDRPKTQAGGSGMKSLFEELEGIGEEFLEFLEGSLGVADAGPGPKNASSSSGSRARPRSGAAYDEFCRMYGIEPEPDDNNGSSSSGSAKNGSNGGSTSTSSNSGSASRASPKGTDQGPSRSNQGTTSSGGPGSTKKDDDIDDILAALKKKHGRL